VEAKNIRTVIFTQGKIHYDLIEHRRANGITDTALVRIEQIHPLPVEQIRAVLKKYGKADRHLWVQEEPINMGAWPYMVMNFPDIRPECISRPRSGAPATGSSKRSAKQQLAIIEQAFAKSKSTVNANA